jgi:hypothetical protein
MNFILQTTLISLFLLSQLPIFAQITAIKKGCTDCNATNYKAKATTDDGSCNYKVMRKNTTLQTQLSDKVIETSGLAWVKGELWTLNDGGNDAAIYKIDTTNGIPTQTVTLDGIKNIDWEDIAASDTHFFIGDFGNNYGDRKEGIIYKIAIKDITHHKDIHIPKNKIEIIHFSFTENNSSNTFKPYQTAFDCEAMFYHKNALHLFTKNWQNYQTAHYILPTKAGKYKIKHHETFDAKGLVTGATISPDGTKVMFVGYRRKGKPFIWQFWDFEGDKFFGGKKQRGKLGSILKVGQVEGITFINNTDGFISNEKFKVPIFKVKQGLRKYAWKSCNLRN